MDPLSGDPQPGQLARPRAILLDWDNTLVENWNSIRAALNVALGEFGLPPMGLEAVKHQARNAARIIFPSLFGRDWPQARAIFEAHFAANHLAGLDIMKGAVTLLDTLRDLAVPLAVVSNKNAGFLRREVAHLGWESRFAAVVGAGEATADKPDAAPLRLALDRMGLEPGADIWMVGDTDIDMRAAVAAGCTPILVGPGPGDQALLAGCAPALRCHNCGDLAGFVLQRGNTISRTY